MNDGRKFEGWITTNSLNHTRYILQKRGIDWNKAADDLGFKADISSDADALISFETLLSLYEYAAEAAGDDALGLSIGASVPIGTVGVFEYVGLSAPTLRTALQNWIRFHSIPTNAYYLSFDEEEDYGCLNWYISDSYGPRAQFVDWSIGLCASRILSMFQGISISLAAEFSHIEPSNIREFKRLLGPNIHFNRSQDRLGVPKHLLDQDLVEFQPRVSEPNLHALVVQAALRELERREHLSDQLLNISEHITEGLKNGNLSLENIAMEMAMSTRTLQRVLDSAGTSFRRLTENIRKAIARRYLTETVIPLYEVAFMCGFSEQSAFSRAAKDWFGVSPKEYRKMKRSGN